MNNNTKNWAFTWGTTVAQKKLPNEIKLKGFLNKNTDYCTFQLECGKIKNKNHFQGAFILSGQRVSKKQLLNLFEENFGNVSGLTLSKVHDKKAAMKYASKLDTRIKGPFHVGRKEKFDEKYAAMTLRPWQQDLFDLMKNHEEFLRDRKVGLENLHS